MLGLARSGMAAALLLRREGIPVYVSDRAGEADKAVGAVNLCVSSASSASSALSDLPALSARPTGTTQDSLDAAAPPWARR